MCPEMPGLPLELSGRAIPVLEEAEIVGQGFPGGGKFLEQSWLTFRPILVGHPTIIPKILRLNPLLLEAEEIFPEGLGGARPGAERKLLPGIEESRTGNAQKTLLSHQSQGKGVIGQLAGPLLVFLRR